MLQPVQLFKIRHCYASPGIRRTVRMRYMRGDL